MWERKRNPGNFIQKVTHKHTCFLLGFSLYGQIHVYEPECPSVRSCDLCAKERKKERKRQQKGNGVMDNWRKISGRNAIFLAFSFFPIVSLPVCKCVAGSFVLAFWRNAWFSPAYSFCLVSFFLFCTISPFPLSHSHAHAHILSRALSHSLSLFLFHSPVQIWMEHMKTKMPKNRYCFTL